MKQLSRLKNMCILVLISFSLGLAGCSAVTTSGDNVQSSSIGEYYQGTIPKMSLKQGVSGGDEIEVSFFQKSLPSNRHYIINVKDKFSVLIDKHPELSAEYTVLPDGTVSFIKLGVMKVAGFTIERLRKTLLDKYATHTLAQREQYQISPGDKFSVNNSDQPELSAEYTVLPDGTVSFIKLGVMKVAGLTVEELKEKLIERYKEHLSIAGIDIVYIEYLDKIDDVNIVYLEHDRQLADFLEQHFKNRRGTPWRINVPIDGTVSFPLINGLNLLGLTCEEIEEKLEAAYSKHFNDLDVNVTLVKQRKTYGATILGEVKSPGIYPLSGQVTSTQLLAIAGGYLTTARLDNVVIIRRDTDNKFYSFKVDIEDAVKEGNLSKEVIIYPTDIVYVPRTVIADVNLFVQQYIRNILPVTYNVGVFFPVR